MLKYVFAFLFLAGFSQAQNIHTTDLAGKGVIKLEQKMTMTCMAIGCPPSKAYYTVSVELESGETVQLQSVDGLIPNLVKFEGFSLAEGDLVYFAGSTREIYKNWRQLVELHEFYRSF